jgi:hypothetical protein
MAADVGPMMDCGGPAVAKAARFLSEAVNLAFHEKLIKQQHALFEIATSMAEVEVAVALVRAASKESALLKAQARVFASDVALSTASRLLKLFTASGALTAVQLEELGVAADLSGAIALQAGRLADMDFIAREITGR